MSQIVIGFSRPKKFFVPFSWLIRLFDGTPYSHTYIKIYSEKYNRWLIYQASGLMVNFMGEAVFNEEALVIKEFPIDISDATRTSIMQFAIDNAGQSYSLKSVFGIAFVKIVNFCGGHMTKNPITGTGFFCSLIVGDIFVEKLGGNLQGDPNLWTPAAIYDVLENGTI